MTQQKQKPTVKQEKVMPSNDLFDQKKGSTGAATDSWQNRGWETEITETQRHKTQDRITLTQREKPQSSIQFTLQFNTNNLIEVEQKPVKNRHQLSIIILSIL